jgi:hypothetical protein
VGVAITSLTASDEASASKRNSSRFKLVKPPSGSRDLKLPRVSLVATICHNPLDYSCAAAFRPFHR